MFNKMEYLGQEPNRKPISQKVLIERIVHICTKGLSRFFWGPLNSGTVKEHADVSQGESRDIHT